MLPFLNMFFQSGQFLWDVVIKIYGNIHLVPKHTPIWHLYLQTLQSDTRPSPITTPLQLTPSISIFYQIG